MKKNKILVIIVCILMVGIGFTSAYYVGKIIFSNEKASVTTTTATLKGAELKIEGELKNDEVMFPGHRILAVAKVTATGEEDEYIQYKIDWNGTNTLNTPLKYKVYKSNQGDIDVSLDCKRKVEVKEGKRYLSEECFVLNEEKLEKVVGEGTINKGETSKEIVDAQYIVAKPEPGNIVYYYIILEYPNIEDSQNEDIGGNFSGKLEVSPNMKPADITISDIYKEDQNGDFVPIDKIPEKEENLVYDDSQSRCNNNASLTWDDDDWSLIVNNLNKVGTTCQLYFAKKDTEGPKVVLSKGETTQGENEWYKSYQTKIQASDERSNIKSLKYCIETNGSTCEPNKEITISKVGKEIESFYQHKAESKAQKICVRAVDEKGNAGDIVCSESVKVDGEKPIIEIGTEVSSGVLTIKITSNSDAGSNNLTYYYKVNDETEDNKNTTYTKTVNTGTYNIEVYAKDEAGNISDSKKTSLEIDADAPTITFEAANVIDGKNNWKKQYSTIIKATDLKNNLKEFKYCLSTNEEECTPNININVSGLTASFTYDYQTNSNIQKVCAKAIDNSNNASEISCTEGVKVDKDNPVIEGEVTASQSKRKITINVGTTTDKGSNIAKYHYTINTNETYESSSATFTPTKEYTTGIYSISVTAEDNAGNISNTKTTTVEVDATAPTISFQETDVTSGSNGWYKAYSTIITATDSKTNLKEFKYCLSTTGLNCSPTNVVSLNNQKNASTTYVFGTNAKTQMVCAQAKDMEDNESEISCTKTVNVDKDNPTITGSVSASSSKKRITITVGDSSDVESGIEKYHYKVGTENYESTSKSYTPNKDYAVGTYSIEVYAEDGAGNISNSKTTSVTIKDPSENTLANLKLKSNGSKTTFKSRATADEGIWSAPDGMYGGTSYYFRGAVTNNYVHFANKYWRIIRINGDGTLRLIYDGDQAYANGDGSHGTNRQIGTKAYNTDNSARKFVGFKYDSGEHGTTTASTILGTASDTSTLYGWYKTYIVDKGYDSKVDQNGLFCNDRNATTNESQTWDEWKKTKTDSTGSSTYYGAYMRFVSKSTVTPTLSCENDLDIFSKTGSTKGNKSLTYPVGLITADEVVFAGGFGITIANTNYYLYTGENYWTMSPLSFDHGFTLVFHVYLGGGLDNGLVSVAYGVRPVINLKADTTFKSGNGSYNTPYEVG